MNAPSELNANKKKSQDAMNIPWICQNFTSKPNKKEQKKMKINKNFVIFDGGLIDTNYVVLIWIACTVQAPRWVLIYMFT